jgi:hypothetical protein
MRKGFAQLVGYLIAWVVWYGQCFLASLQRYAGAEDPDRASAMPGHFDFEEGNIIIKEGAEEQTYVVLEHTAKGGYRLGDGEGNACEFSKLDVELSFRRVPRSSHPRRHSDL